MITIYLDTSDYSILSNPKNNDERLKLVKERLIEFSLRDNIKFVFSGITVGETVPLHSADVSRSHMALKLIRELCGGNCLTTWDNFLRQELSFAFGIRNEPCQPHGVGSIWIPGMKVSHPRRGEPVKFIDEYLRGEIKIGETLGNFDWVIQNYGSATDISSHYREYVREIGRSMARNNSNLVNYMLNLPESKTRSEWLLDTRVMNFKMAKVYSDSLGLQPKDDGQPIDLVDIETCCPGLSVMNGCQMEFLWTYIGGQAKKEISNSVFPDALHAMYAPYVDIFRADQTMAPHIKTALKSKSTKVVARLLDLPDVIEESLTAQR